LLSQSHYGSDNNLNNFTIQDREERGPSIDETDQNINTETDQVLLRHSRMIDSAKEDKKLEPTPLTTMYYNDPKYVNKFPNIDEKKDITSTLNNQVNARVARNGVQVAEDSQQASDSLLQRMVFNPDGHQQVSRPATKEDYVIHEVKISDTLERICIQYDVNKDAIKMANGFLGEEVYMYKTLKIPFTYGEVYHVPEDKNPDVKKEWAKEQMHQVVRDVNRDNGSYESEVKYYLEIHDFDMDKAMRAYQEDMRFEKQAFEENKKYLQQKKRQRFVDMGCGSCLCFGFL
jgi:LysM repeat protein